MAFTDATSKVQGDFGPSQRFSSVTMQWMAPSSRFALGQDWLRPGDAYRSESALRLVVLYALLDLIARFADADKPPAENGGLS